MTTRYSKRLLSGSTNGRGIVVDTTGTPGTLIHTSIAGTSSMDEVWIYAINESAAECILTLEWGGTSSPDDTMTVAIQPLSGLQLVAPGLLLNNSTILRAFASYVDIIMVHGYVNRIAN
jgi:hypothetical protein